MPMPKKKNTFSQAEKDLLVSLARKNPIVDYASTSAQVLAAKKNRWQKIEQMFNASGVGTRSAQQLKGYWENIKRHPRSENGAETSDRLAICAGPSSEQEVIEMGDDEVNDVKYYQMKEAKLRLEHARMLIRHEQEMHEVRMERERVALERDIIQRDLERAGKVRSGSAEVKTEVVEVEEEEEEQESHDVERPDD